MKFIWENGEVYCRCTVRPKVRITTKEWAGNLKPMWVDAVGFIRIYDDGLCTGNLYGTVSDAHPKKFAHLDQAKAWVEEQALIGLTLNKLTR
jgi:hypothetical protein